MFTITRDGHSATIDEDLNVASNDEQLLQDLLFQKDLAEYGNDTALPVLLVLYNNLKSNPEFTLKVDDPDTLAELNGDDYDEETIF